MVDNVKIKERHRIPILWGSTFLLLGLMVSCAFPIVRTVEVTRVVPQTVVVTELLVVIYTATQPAVIRPEIPMLAATSIPFQIWDTQQVVQAFQTARLEVGEVRPMISDDYGLVPMLAVDGKRFFIPSVCSDCGGRIMSFANQEDLTIVKNYYEQMARYGAVLFSWVFVKDNILVQINGQLPEADAVKYEAALEGLK